MQRPYSSDYNCARMALTLGTKLGPYEIIAPLGAGGMGEVYRARDTRLDRDVAVKVLLASLSADTNLKQRLEREAKAVSKLSHPHICTLHDIGQQDGVDFLVMELVEGETLEQRLTKGPLPAEQTVRYAAQIADALAKAHKLGFTHRDLKPANIILTKSGAKLMDFGLAKQSGPAPLAQALTEMTMEHSTLTGEGTIIGTFQYMAPEQLEGKEADARTDIFALGEVIYEMATAKAAFAGKSRASLIAAILTTEPPPITQVQPLTPPALERVVRKCLAKDPDDRWQSASDLTSELNWISVGGSQAGVAAPVASRRRSRERVAWAVAVLGLSAAALLATIQFEESTRPTRVVRSFISAEEGTSLMLTGDFAGPPVLSPDGNSLAFVAAREQGAVFLWVRPLNDIHARALANTDGATFPFWSADGRSLGFFAGGKLKTVPVEGGTPSEVCDAPSGRGGTWNAEGTIVFSPSYQSALLQVQASGGTPKPATVVDRSKHDSHRWPYFLADGKHFLYLAVIHGNVRSPNDAIYFASLDGKENRMVMQGLTNVEYAAGRLLFVRDTALMAQRFDPRTGAVRGETERLAENVLVDGTVWRSAFDASGDGLLAYASGGLIPWQAMWYDRSGKQLGVAGEKAFNLVAVRLSPDGTRLATESGENGGQIWIYDRRRQVNARLTFGAGASSSPVWSPDGQWIAYAGVRGKNNLYRKPANGMGQEELLFEGDGTPRALFDWAPDGRSLLFGVGDLVSKGRVWVLPLAAQARALDARHLCGNQRQVFAGRPLGGIYLERIRPAGGVRDAVWRRCRKVANLQHGRNPAHLAARRKRTLLSSENTLLSVPITLKPGVAEVGAAQQVFRFNNPVGILGIVSPYDVTADGQHLVLITTTQQASRSITLVTSWAAELKK